MKNKPNSAFTLLEVMIVVIIILIISGIVFASLSLFNGTEALNTEANTIVSIIDRARLRTEASEYGTQYDVRFASTTITLSAEALDTRAERHSLNPDVIIQSINLSNQGSDIFFSLITGKASATGTIVLSLVNNPNITKTITIYGTGLSDVK